MQASVSWAPKTLPNQPAKAPTGERQCPKFQVFREIRQTTQAGANLSHTRRTGPLKTICENGRLVTPWRPEARLASRARRRPVFAKTRGRPGRSASLSLWACMRGVKGLVVVLPASGSVSWAPKGGPIASAAITFSVSWAPKTHLAYIKHLETNCPARMRERTA